MLVKFLPEMSGMSKNPEQNSHGPELVLFWFSSTTHNVIRIDLMTSLCNMNMNATFRPMSTLLGLLLFCRGSDDNIIYRLPVLYDSVHSCDVHGPTTSQDSLLPHEPRSTLLCLLHHLHHHLRSASCLRRTSRRRLAFVLLAGRFLLQRSNFVFLVCYFQWLRQDLAWGTKIGYVGHKMK